MPTCHLDRPIACWVLADMTTQSIPPSVQEVTIAIAALGKQAANLTLPAPAAGLRYLVMVQSPPTPLPDSDRSDVLFIPLDTIGLSHSRNGALACCQTPLLVFADNDMTLDTQGLRALANHLTHDSTLDFAAGWRAGKRPATGPRSGPYRLHKLNAGRICAPELIVRIDAVHAAGLQFDPRFGVGAEQPVGEDFIFVCDMLDAGLRGAGFPVETGAHNGPSSGDNWHDADILQARRAVLTRSFGPLASLVRVAYVWRHRRRFPTLKNAWWFFVGKSR